MIVLPIPIQLRSSSCCTRIIITPVVTVVVYILCIIRDVNAFHVHNTIVHSVKHRRNRISKEGGTSSTTITTSTVSTTINAIINVPIHWRTFVLYFDVSNSNSNDDNNDDYNDNDWIIQQQQQQQINYNTVRSILLRNEIVPRSSSSSSSSLPLPQQFDDLIPLEFRSDGSIELPTSITNTAGRIRCMVLHEQEYECDHGSKRRRRVQPPASTMMTTPPQQQQRNDDDVVESKPSLLVPMNIDQTTTNRNDDWWWSLTQQQQQRNDLGTQRRSNNNNNNHHHYHHRTGGISKFELRRQTSFVIHRHASNGLYDNLPYHWYDNDKNNDRKRNTTGSRQQQSPFGATAALSSSSSSSSASATTIGSGSGKRECYNLLLGKDWYLWNIKKRNEQLQQPQSQQEQTDGATTTLVSTRSTGDVSTTSSLSSLERRIVQLQIHDYQSQIAECDSEIAYLVQQEVREQQRRLEPNGNEAEADDDDETILNFPNNTREDLNDWQLQREVLVQLLQNATIRDEQSEQTVAVSNSNTNVDSNNNSFTTLSTNIWSTIQRNFNSLFATDDDEEDDDGTAITSTRATVASTPTLSATTPSWNTAAIVPYRNAYDMIHQRIIQDMLHANVIGVFLENMSLLDVESGMTLGGVLLLQKKKQSATTRVQLLGETISLLSSASDGVSSKNDDDNEIYFVECHVDEAIGMSVACNLPLWIDKGTWERGAVMCSGTTTRRRIPNDSSISSNNKKYGVQVWRTNDPELSVLMEGQSSNASSTERGLPIRIPRITNLYDSTTMINENLQQTGLSSSTSSRASKDLFPTDNIIQSLKQYDKMSMDDKARTFMAMSNTQQIRLPRRRTVQQQQPNGMDELLIPFIDESVRYEYNLRRAQQTGDTGRVQELQQQQSIRSKLRTQSMNLLNSNTQEMTIPENGTNEYWEKEIELYTSLRADITQDVGSYSRFLDRDEWYERDRQRMVQRMVDRQKEAEKQKTDDETS